MFPAPFKPASAVLKEQSSATVPVPVRTTGPVNPPKTSRFSSLFQKDLVAPASSVGTVQEAGKVLQPQGPRNFGKQAPNQMDLSRTSSTSSNRSEPKRLFVENITFSAKKEDVVSFFKDFKIMHMDIPKRRDGSLKGIAYVTVESDEEARNAIFKLNNTILKGRKARISYARSPGGQRKSSSDKSKSSEKSQQRAQAFPVATQTKDISNATKRPVPDAKKTLRKAMYDVACDAIMRGEKTPDEIFCEINFNEEEKMMLRDFYVRHIFEQSKKCTYQPQTLTTETLEQSCSTHGLDQCVDCYQALFMEQTHHEEQKENTQLNVNTGMHQNPLSWNSSGVLGTNIHPGFPDGTGVMTLAPQNPNQSSGYPDLSAYNALRLFGPKYLKDNFDQEDPQIHNTYVSVNGRPGYENPFERQNAIVPTQPGIKTHCAFYLRTGYCDFGQQGCKFSHELPPGGLAELAAQTATRRPPRVQHNGFNSHRNGVTRSVFDNDGPRRASGQRFPSQANIQVPYNRPIGVPLGRGQARGNPFLALTEMNLDVEPDYQTIGYTYPQEDTFQGNRRRAVNNFGRGFNQQRQVNQVWRDVASWRDNMRHVSGMLTGTDGAADDEESSSDLISLSSFNH